jgi:hypothetical protein
MKTSFVPALLIAVTCTGCAYLGKVYQDPPAAEPAIAADPSKPNSPANTSEAIARNNVILQQIAKSRLGPAEIQSDLDGGVTIVRTRENVVSAPTGPVDDTAIVAQVRQALQADPEVGIAGIEVKAQQGEVALTGTAASAARIGRAIATALEVPGVRKVSSDVKVSGAARP